MKVKSKTSACSHIFSLDLLYSTIILALVKYIKISIHGPLPENLLGYLYVVAFIHKPTGWVWTFPLKLKSDTLDTIKLVVSELRSDASFRSFDRNNIVFQFDNAKEFI